ncbi:MAG: type 1 glutamine amidotransferase domain-containing protein [Reichenbachiella sp.]
MKKYPILKWSLTIIASLILMIVAFGFWFVSLLTTDTPVDIKSTQRSDLPYLNQTPQPFKGKILAVVTSCAVMGSSQKKTGYELTELARPYFVFEANGYEVDVASPLGGKPPVIIDWDDMGAFDYAFLNDANTQEKANNTIAINNINADDYDAIYFAGGKGAMFDFPENEKIQSIIREMYQSGKVIGAVCHGPAALVNVTLEDGTPLLKNKNVSGFTNEEELFLIPDANTIFPFLLQDKMSAQGANFNQGTMYLQNVQKEGQLVTGQNPWSTWSFSETIIEQLGYQPVKRNKTAEENTVEVLMAYEETGYAGAKKEIKHFISNGNKPIDKNLLAMHSIVAAMQWKIGKTINIIRLLSFANQ